MAATEHAPVPLDQRVEKMDMELKDHFVEMRAFTSNALEGLEDRLGKRIDRVESQLGKRISKVEARLDKLEERFDTLEHTMKLGFQTMNRQLVELRTILLTGTHLRTRQRRRRS